ncbi:hypothetical protein EST38_g1502 [Candolleomyces aberdarensis]|uniref:Uncharacterized protein n=1 Tax=Candolleomyces aberdarensis TaxID=2316362 RepID=A0A4Q2DXD0_9AGAR|nr:hypothetical protein EST38_g1502 [Candolleomyces aberdarensis]
MQSVKVQPSQTIGSIPKPPFPFESNQPTWFGRSNPAFRPAYNVPTPAPPKPKKQRNVIVVNGIEIDLDGPDDAPAPAPKPQKKRNIPCIEPVEIPVLPVFDHLEWPPHTPAFNIPISYPFPTGSFTTDGRVTVLRLARTHPLQAGCTSNGPAAIFSSQDPAAEFSLPAPWFVLRFAEFQAAA